ncbi:MAG TPA: hypothetical protein VF914_21680 [Chloroflexia bacterium]|jgi:hypothetical protein
MAAIEERDDLVEDFAEDAVDAPYTLAEQALGIEVDKVVKMPVAWLVEDPANERQALVEVATAT